jgi:hypothetical protein
MYKETLVPYLNQGHTPSAEYIFGSLMRPTLQAEHQKQVTQSSITASNG